MNDSSFTPRRTRNEGKLVVPLPRRKKQLLSLYIYTFIVSVLDILICFSSLIVQSVRANKLQLSVSTLQLPSSVIQIHITWGIPISFSLYFVEDSLNWSLNRKCGNFGTVLTLLILIIFFILVIYSWLWANDNAGITFICKYFLSSFGLSISPDQIRQKAYNDQIQEVINYLVGWLLPLQCLIVLLDCIFSMCRKQHQRNVLINTKPKNGIVLVKLVGIDVE